MKFIPKHIKFITLSLLLLLAISFVFRTVLFALNYNLASNENINSILYCFFNRGMLFDLYIALLILILPYLLTSILYLINKSNKTIVFVSNYFIIALGVILIIISASDIAFFKYYNQRLTNAIFDWTNDILLMLKIMLGNTDYLPYIISGVVVSVLYFILQKKIFQISFNNNEQKQGLIYRILIFVISFTLIFFGVRGTFNLNHRPLNSDDAFFSTNPFLNQLSFNPAFTLANSYKKDKIRYFENDSIAVSKALQYLKRKKSKERNPFAQIVQGNDSIKPNIVLIFVESLSKSMVSRYNKKLHTTKNIDSLAQNGLCFDNIYSAGIHTYNGIFSSLYGLPAIMHNKPLNSIETSNKKFNGLPFILKSKGYDNVFYITGDEKFDNMNGFLLPNGYDRIVSEKDYPQNMIENGWGVSDKTMFNRILSDCDSLHFKGKPFFVTALTISSHEGYDVLPWCKHKFIHNKYPEKRYEFMDLMIGDFFDKAKDKTWFNNTVFVIIGDHGQNFYAKYDMNINYHKIPMIFYSPKLIKPDSIKKTGLQIDLYPTLCGLLDFSYLNNSLGVDLLKEDRKYAYFSADTKLGVADNNYYLIYRSKDNISLYKQNEYKDIYMQNKKTADEMCSYAFSMLQSAQYLIENNLQYPVMSD